MNMTRHEKPRFIDLGPLARIYARYRVAQYGRMNARRSQEKVLRRLVKKAAGTRFGKAHAFGDITHYADYKDRVDLHRYEDLWRDWWQPDFPTLVDVTWPGKIPYFALSAGTTTGKSKHIPYTLNMRRAAALGFVDLLCFHYCRKPTSKLLGGAALALTGPKDLERKEDSAMAGAVSAITIGSVPGFLNRRVLPPAEIARMENWTEKIRSLAEMAPGSNVRFLGGSPNWMLVFLEELARQHGGDRLVNWFPDLELIVHGGINFAPYRDRFRTLLEGSHAETREMYSASEGVFAVADRGDGEGLRLILDGTVFFEFVPSGDVGAASPRRYTVDQVVTGRDYAVAISTAAGLWSYLVGDVVRFVGLDPPRVLVVGRVGNTMSAFGEHLIESEIAEAIAAAAGSLGLKVQDYCMGAVHTQTGGHHLYLVEASGVINPGTSKDFAGAVDETLRGHNADYRELRNGNTAIQPPRVKLLKRSAFQEWMQLRRQLGGQNKLPKIVVDPSLFADINSFVTRAHLANALS